MALVSLKTCVSLRIKQNSPRSVFGDNQKFSLAFSEFGFLFNYHCCPEKHLLLSIQTVELF